MTNITKFTSGFGKRIHPIMGKEKMHFGIDIAAPQGTPVLATGDGIVVKVIEKHKGYGLYIHIQNDEIYSTRFAQLSQADVKVGDSVRKGDKIGEVGSSGLSTAPHLHYEIFRGEKRVNPETIIGKGDLRKVYPELQ